MSTSSSKAQASNEEILNQKLDVCLSNALVKTGLGFVAGSALSLVLFKRRAYPIWLATGFGVGSGYSDCQRLYTPLTLPGLRVLPSTSSRGAQASEAGVLEKLSDKAGNAIASGRKDLEPHLENAKDIIQDKAQQVKSEIADKTRDVVDAAQDKAVELKDKAVGGAKEVKDKVRSV